MRRDDITGRGCHAMRASSVVIGGRIAGAGAEGSISAPGDEALVGEERRVEGKKDLKVPALVWVVGGVVIGEMEAAGLGGELGVLALGEAMGDLQTSVPEVATSGVTEILGRGDTMGSMGAAETGALVGGVVVVVAAATDFLAAVPATQGTIAC
jgi:hypothetical protein